MRRLVPGTRIHLPDGRRMTVLRIENHRRAQGGLVARRHRPQGGGMRVLVCGSRRFADPFTVSLTIDERIARLPERSTVIHGAANGADKIAGEAAERHGHDVETFPADWDTYGRRAGVMRNILMLNSRPELVLAFWDGRSRGTAHTIAEARRRGIPVEVLSA